MFNSHSLSHDFISTDRESPLLPTVWNTDVNEIPSFKRGADIAMIDIKMMRALEGIIQNSSIFT